MYIIHLGTSGFPIGNNAVIQRIKLTFKGLKLAGCNPLIISKHSLYKTELTSRINRYQGIPYVSTSMLINRPDNFIVRNLNRISGYLGELILLVKKRKSIHTAIVTGVTFSELLYYRLLSKILNFKIIIHYVELVSSISGRKNTFSNLNAKLIDNYSFFFCDSIIVISEFLKNRVLAKNKTLPIIKIPAICDFEEFDFVEDVTQGQYLMYCGSIGYLSVIEFIIDLYNSIRELNFYHGELLLAIGVGDKNGESYRTLMNKIAQSQFSNDIVLKTNVPHNDLIKIYLESELLIAPMRNVVQDIAGFHHKVGEYSAARKPIISTKLGEMKYYFTDGISAILADEYTVESYIQKLREFLPLKDQLKKIAEEGNRIGTTNLNYLKYGAELKQFIDIK